MAETPRILLNAVWHETTKTVLISANRHDFNAVCDENGKIVVAVDGGLEYLKRAAMDGAVYEDITITTESTMEEIGRAFACIAKADLHRREQDRAAKQRKGKSK